MDAADAYIARLIEEKRQAQDYAQAWAALAGGLQQLADGTGQGFGLPPLTPSLPLPVLQQVARQLRARLQPPEPLNGHDGTRIPVAAGAGKEATGDE
jgi:hypothetical protein